MKALAGILLCSAAFGQSFEVASVKIVAPDFTAPMETGSESFRMANALFYLVEWAYGLQDYQLSGGPD
jgi:uncharacterized protein (TIGR03435 family)